MYRDVYYAPTGSDNFKVLLQLRSVNEGKKAPVQPHILIDERPDAQEDSVWIVQRNGQITHLALHAPYTAQNSDLDCSPLAAAMRHDSVGPVIAIFDRRKNQIMLLRAFAKGDIVRVLAASKTLETDKKPLNLCWASETTLFLADSLSSIWISEIVGEEVRLVLAGRLVEKGVTSLSAPECMELDHFLVGQPTGCSEYRIVSNQQGGRTIELVSVLCLNNGSVRQISSYSGRLEYLCANNAASLMVNERGEAVSRDNHSHEQLILTFQMAEARELQPRFRLS